jgi:2-oxo-4-hydroxy-4-carboxy-5-ureidoimidazoline decarboxylase
MSDVLARWNRLSSEEAAKEILPCCGSKAWAQRLVSRRPLANEAALLAASDEIWFGLAAEDWMEAFHSHPRIGEKTGAKIGEKYTAQSPGQSAPVQSAWSEQEQRNVAAAGEEVKTALAEANRKYEHQFGHIFIVCATGKSGSEILEILRRRLQNDRNAELREAAEQQRQITHIRLRRWLS